MQQVDLVSIGDAIVDVLVRLPDDDKHLSIDLQKEQVVMELGAKIPVEKSSFSIGGNATHVAIGLSRLGFVSALAVELGTDEFADKILKDLDKEHVAKNLLIQTPGAQSTFTVSLSVGNDRTTLVRHVKREHKFHLDKLNAKWVYLTSMGEKWEDVYAQTVEYAKKTGAKLVCNPGSMQFKDGVERFRDVIAASDVLIVNKEEAEMILYNEVLSKEKKESAESLLFRLQRMGPSITVITDGENGAYALDGGTNVVMQKTFPVEVTEKTGAGDGFSAGFLGAMMLDKNLEEALLWGTANAAGVITKIGGQEGLLTRAELIHMIQQYS